MDVRINVMGSGACPFCRLNKRCLIQSAITNSLEEYNDPESDGLELAIYSCPRFEEINT